MSAAHHDHEHFRCCGQLFHGREAYDEHRADEHGEDVEEDYDEGQDWDDEE